MVPEGGVVLPNRFGTAPGLIVENDRTTAILLPGPPRELRPMWEEEALPWLSRRFADRLQPVHEITLRPPGHRRIARAAPGRREGARPRAGGDRLLRRPGEVDLRLLGPDAELVRRAAELARSLVGDALYAENRETMEEVVVRLATAAGKTVAVAESCTGGLVAHRLTNVPGSSAILRYGWITYADEAKTAELGVPVGLLKAHGAVSAEVAQAMAEGALRAGGADIAVAVTGIAGPDGGTRGETGRPRLFRSGGERRSDPDGKETLSPDRETFKAMASQIALDLVRRALVE